MLWELSGDGLRRRSRKNDGVTALPSTFRHPQDYPSKRKVASSDRHVPLRSHLRIASMSLHRDLPGHATDSTGNAPGSTPTIAAMPIAVHLLLDSMRAWHDR